MAPKWYQSAKLLDVVIDDQPVTMLSYEAVAEQALEEFPLKVEIPVEHAQLGKGCNTFSGDVRGNALMADEALIDPGVKQGQEKLFYLNLVKNKHELNKEMEVSASASYSGLFSASAKSKFVSDQKLNSESVYLIVKVLVTNSRREFKEYKSSEGFAKFIAKDPINWKQFLAKYGDQFIYSIVSGGEFYALYEFHTDSVQQKNELEAHLEGSGFGFTAAADFMNSLEKIDTNVNITCSLYIRGGKDILPEIKDDTIIDAALAFPQAVDPEGGAPVDYKAETQDYDVVDDFPGYPDEVKESLDQNTKVCNEITLQLAQIENLEQSLIMKGDFDDMTEKKLGDIKKELIKELQEIAKNPLSKHEMPSQQIDKIKKIEAEHCWEKMPGNLAQISAGSKDYVYGVSYDQIIWQWNIPENNWIKNKQVNARGVYVSVGADGTAWHVNRENKIYRWDVDKNVWTEIHGTLKQISVGSKDHVWGISSDNRVWQWENQNWVLRTTNGKVLSVGSDGTVFLLDKNNQVLKWNKDNASFEQFIGELSHISVGNATQIWGIDTKSQVVRWDGETWKTLLSTRKLKSVSAGDDGTVWGVDGQGNVFRLNSTLLPEDWFSTAP